MTEDLLQFDDSKITRANRGIDIVQDVKNGKLDAVVIDKATGVALAQKEKVSNLLKTLRFLKQKNMQ